MNAKKKKTTKKKTEKKPVNKIFDGPYVHVFIRTSCFRTKRTIANNNAKFALTHPHPHPPV